MNELTVGFALTGSYCTFSKVIPQIENVIKIGYKVIPIMSENVCNTDTRFGKAADFKKEIEKIKKELSKLVKENIQISIMEVKNPDLNARLVAEGIAHQIENRVSFRVSQKRAIRNTMKAGAKGIKTSVSGRLGGADMARTEGYTEGNIPLHTLRADVDYSHKEADTTYGKIGVKVWIYKGEVLPKKNIKGGNSHGSNSKKSEA